MDQLQGVTSVPQPGWLEPLLKAVQSGEADICGARLLYPDGRCQHAGIAFDERGLGYHIFGGFAGDAPEVQQRREMQAVTGACLMISKQLFSELGGFDEGFLNGFEDVDLCLRAGELGKKILYQPESVVIHYAEQTPERKDHDLPNMQRFFRRWSGKLRQDDQHLYRQFGLTCSKDQEGRFRITREPDSAPQVSIIIPLFNQAPLTEACLSALQRSTPQGRYELILVDNGSMDGTPALLERWQHAATIIRNHENHGFARACNQGARAARGEYLLFLNNDTEVTDGWLEALLRVVKQDASVAAVGSKLLYPDGTLQHAGVLLVDDQQQGDPLVGRHLYQRMPGNHPPANVMRTLQALTAACLLVRRQDFKAVSGFDEGYWNGYEDLDLCLKLAAAGKRLVYQPLSVVTHHESQSGPERFRQAAANIQRLHQHWLGKVQVDAIIQADGTIQHGPGMLNGTTAIYQPPVAQAVAQQEAQLDTTARQRRYQLVPLVAGSASSLVQRLSSSRRTRDVLQRYTVDD
jgi:GT2 family glycosyltransferase